MKKTQKKSESILNYFTKLDGGKNKATLSDSTNHLNISTLRKRKTSGHLSQPSKKSKAANSIKSRSDDTKNSTGGSYSKSSTSSGSFPMSSTSSGSYSMSNTTSGSYSMSPIDNSGQTYSMKNMCNTSRTTTFHMTTDNISLYTDENRYRSSSPAGSVSSQNSISSASRYDKKGVLVEVSGTRQGVPFSSQKSILSQDKYNPPSVEKKEVMKTKNEITTSYQWMGNTDVQPFSSNYSPYKNTSQLESIHPSGGNRSWATPVTTLTNKNFSTWDSSHSVNRPPRSLPTKTGMPVGVYGGRPSGGYGGKTSGRPVGRPPGRPPGRSGTGSSFASAETPFATKKNTNYRPELSSEQKKVLKMVVDEEVSLFFTGSAGTGKSVLLRAIIDELRTKFGAQLAVTASTGIAACNINGSTLHSFGGIGIGKDNAAALADKIRNDNRRALERWTSTRVLIIDEISMIDAELFDKLDAIARNLRRNDAPFGGIQLIVTGDFFQLPPVSPDRSSKFAFQANSWNKAIRKTVLLTHVFRQKDETFVKILNEMRTGIISPEAIEIFSSLSRKPIDDSDIEPTELYPLRNEVDNSNRRRLEALTGEAVKFRAIDKGDMKSCIAPTEIELKLHAQVMLLKNIDADLVNGSLGVVVGFVGSGKYTTKQSVEYLRAPNKINGSYKMAGEKDDGIDMTKPFPIVKFSDGRLLVLEYESWSIELPGGKVVASRYQIPLMLAWAISIHKSQGQTLDRVKVDLGKVFESGQAYVALSRATSLERLQILNFTPSKVMVHPSVATFYRDLETV